MPKGTEITKENKAVQAQGAQLPTAQVEALSLELAKEAAERHRKICLAALAATKPRNWLNMEGTPYLTAAGASLVQAMLSIHVRLVEWHKIPEEPSGYTILCLGEACAEKINPGVWTAVSGAASSNDGFLTKGGKKLAAQADVFAKAMTKMRLRAVRELVGVSAFEWDELEKVGIAQSQVPKVQIFTAGSKDLAGVRVRYTMKDAFVEFVKARFRVRPQWDSEKRLWMIPKEALELPELVEFLETDSEGEKFTTAKQEKTVKAETAETPELPPDPLFT
jgi:hypothetical protein